MFNFVSFYNTRVNLTRFIQLTFKNIYCVYNIIFMCMFKLFCTLSHIDITCFDILSKFILNNYYK